jgi:DMSO/TMAO reductase YedYZ molybdopterin-dependent catalytic subunit
MAYRVPDTRSAAMVACLVMKPLDIDHARDGEVMLAFQMNDEQLPLLNATPL